MVSDSLESPKSSYFQKQEDFVTISIDDVHQSDQDQEKITRIVTTEENQTSAQINSSTSTPNVSICEPEYPDEDGNDDLGLTKSINEPDNHYKDEITIATTDAETVKSTKDSKLKVLGQQMTQIVWFNVLTLLTVHVFAIWGYFWAIFIGIKWQTIILAFNLGVFSGIGMSVGAHRLWAHRSFKARWPLRLLLTIFQTMSMNGSTFSYARDHRTHHKYSDSSSDPKNSRRDFFFAHMGWWLVRKNQEVLTNGKKVKIDDLLADPFVYYQNKFYYPLVIIIWGVIPTVVPYCWGEDLLLGNLIYVNLRYIIFLHHFFTVNSIAHFWGYRPYGYHIRPTENRLVAYLSLGEGSNYYHHVFPWDYRSSQQGWLYGWDPYTLFIDVACWLGVAYDRKKPSRRLIESIVLRTGIPQHFRDWNWKAKKVRAPFFGGVDWVIGFLVATWIYWLPVIVKPIVIILICAMSCEGDYKVILECAFGRGILDLIASPVSSWNVGSCPTTLLGLN